MIGLTERNEWSQELSAERLQVGGTGSPRYRRLGYRFLEPVSKERESNAF